MLKEDIKECIAKVIEAAIRLTQRSGVRPRQLAQMLLVSAFWGATAVMRTREQSKTVEILGSIW